MHVVYIIQDRTKGSQVNALIEGEAWKFVWER